MSGILQMIYHFIQFNHDLDIFKSWAHNWRMSFNPDPNEQKQLKLPSQGRGSQLTIQ